MGALRRLDARCRPTSRSDPAFRDRAMARIHFQDDRRRVLCGILDVQATRSAPPSKCSGGSDARISAQSTGSPCVWRSTRRSGRARRGLFRRRRQPHGAPALGRPRRADSALRPCRGSLLAAPSRRRHAAPFRRAAASRLQGAGASLPTRRLGAAWGVQTVARARDAAQQSSTSKHELHRPARRHRARRRTVGSERSRHGRRRGWNRKNTSRSRSCGESSQRLPRWRLVRRSLGNRQCRPDFRYDSFHAWRKAFDRPGSA